MKPFPQQLGNELLQHHCIDYLLGVTLFFPQLLPAGIVKLLGECEWLANPLHGQHAELLMVLLRGAGDMLHDGPF